MRLLSKNIPEREFCGFGSNELCDIGKLCLA